MSYLGLDIGQTGCKAVIFDERGRQLSAAYREYKTVIPAEGLAELDSNEVRDSCFSVMMDAQSGCSNDPVRGLGISSQGEAFTPVGADGRYLANAMITFDTRAAQIAETWSKKFGLQKLYETTGHTAHPMFSLFKLLWLRDNMPEVFKDAVKFLCFEDLLQHALGLEPHIAWPLAGRTMMFNIIEHRWEERIIGEVGIDASKLAVPAPSGTAVGKVDPSIARDIGFAEDVVVAAAGHDQPLGALGAGVVTAGKAMYATGTSECITPAFKEPVLSEELFRNNLCTYDYVMSGMYTTVSFSLTGGNILRWFRDEWGQSEVAEAEKKGVSAYELLLQSMSDEPSRLLVLPYFTPSGTPYFDTEVPGAILGLRLSTKRSEVLRALLEGVALEMRLNLEILNHSGIHIEELRAIGGGAKSVLWTQLKADVLDTPITTLFMTEAACLAGAMLACSAHTDEPVASVVKRWVKTGPVLRPDPKRAEVYSRVFEKYRDLYHGIKSLGITGAV
jgi:xylulokinase